MNRSTFKKTMQPKLDAAFNECRQRIADMESQKEHPQIALCIEKNRGYMMALSDVTEMLYAGKFF